MDSINEIITNYGIINVAVMVITAIIVSLIKIPINRKSNKIIELANKIGVELDKNAISAWMSYLPFVIAGIQFVIKELVLKRNALGEFDYAMVVINTVVYGGMSIGVFDVIATNIKRLKYRKSYSQVIGEFDIQRKMANSDLPKLEEQKNTYVSDEENNQLEAKNENI